MPVNGEVIQGEPLTIRGSSMDPLGADLPQTFVQVVRPLNIYCAACGRSMMAVKWLHYEKVVQQGYQDFDCLNQGCQQFRKTARVPVVTENFPQV